MSLPTESNFMPVATISESSQNIVKNPTNKSKSWKGAGFKILSCLCFAALNAIVRYLTGGADGSVHSLTPSQLACLQNIIGSLFIIPWIIQQGFQTFKTNHPYVHGIRVIIAAAGIIMLYYAFKLMPIAEAVALQFTGPLFTAFGAWLCLKERLGLGRCLGIIMGVIGAFIITRPDRAFDHGLDYQSVWILCLPVGSAVAFSIAKLLGRYLAKGGESAALLTCYLVIFMVPATLGPALYDWVWPTAIQWIYIVALGFCAWAGHYTLAKAFSHAEILFLTPFGFSRFIFSAIVAWLAFSELPRSIHFWIGAVIILISTVLISADERITKNKPSSL